MCIAEQSGSFKASTDKTEHTDTVRVYIEQVLKDKVSFDDKQISVLRWSLSICLMGK